MDIMPLKDVDLYGCSAEIVIEDALEMAADAFGDDVSYQFEDIEMFYKDVYNDQTDPVLQYHIGNQLQLIRKNRRLIEQRIEQLKADNAK